MPSFDVVSKIAQHELENAVQQAQKEVTQRFDFKDTGTEIERNEDGIVVRADSEARVEAAFKVVQEKVVKRSISVKVLDPQKVEPGARGAFRQLVKIKEGIAIETAREMVKFLKDSKIKAQAAIQGDQLRVTGKKKDDLQEAIALLKGKDFGLPLQFINFRD